MGEIKIAIEIKNVDEFKDILLDVRKKAQELQEAIQKLDNFELKLETNSSEATGSLVAE